MTTIYVYSNETGQQVAHHTGADNDACEQWADDNYGINDYHWAYCDVAVSNAGKGLSLPRPYNLERSSRLVAGRTERP